MAMTVVVTGKMYNGKVHDWKDKKKNERSMFRGRLNYRDRTTGEWIFIDAVCWKDFGDNNGLVGFLDNHFSATSDSAPTDKGGQPIELVGYIEPTTKILPFDVKGKTSTKTFDVEYPTFQFVIETVDFPPNNEKREKKNNGATVDDDFDFEEEEDFDLPEDDEDEEEVAETPKEKAARVKAEKAKAAKAAKLKAERDAKAKAKDEEEDDEEFFNK